VGDSRVGGSNGRFSWAAGYVAIKKYGIERRMETEIPLRPAGQVRWGPRRRRGVVVPQRALNLWERVRPHLQKRVLETRGGDATDGGQGSGDGT